jgi:hypothetical protein
MSDGPSNLERRQKALQAVRRHVRRLEIETHRVKAHLARLEADYEEDIADWMSRKLRRRASAREQRVDSAHDGVPASGENGDGAVAEAELLHGPIAFGLNADAENRAPRRNPAAQPKSRAKLARTPVGSSPFPRIETDVPEQNVGARHLRHRTTRRNTARPVMASLAVHAVGLLFCISFGFATVMQQAVPLFASPNSTDESAVEELSEVEIELTKFEDDELQNVVAHATEFNLADNSLREFEPMQLGVGSQPLDEIGQLDTLPSDLDALMSGGGSPGSGPPGGERGAAVFFGARSQGDRFVFVVDNSSSMKDGRLEAAIAELIRSIEAMSPRQAFYVIFVSDRIYPMFYPQAAPDLLLATPPNKKRLAEWLPRAATASGKNRELVKAMDMAARLRPHSVFFLWDGRMDHAGVRQEVMTHLTRPNQWNFPIHTLGMGVDSLDSEYNLAAIAQASGGTFRRVDVPAARGR